MTSEFDLDTYASEELDASSELTSSYDGDDENVQGDTEEFTGEFADIAQRYKNGEELTDADIDRIADCSLEVIRAILKFFDAQDSQIDEYEGDNGELIFDITNPDLAVLIGRHGKTLDAIQILVSTIINKKLNFRFPVVIDVESYKNRRKEKVVQLALSCASKAINQRRTVKLHPMSAYERRLIHLTLRGEKRVNTYSEGEEPERRVVIQPR